MFNSLKKLLYEGTPLLSQSRSYANFAAATRIEEPIKKKPEPLEIDNVTGYKILKNIDYSGFDHRMLIDYESKDSRGYYSVYGMFTTSKSAYMGKKPEFVASYTLLGTDKFQLFHRYSEVHIIHEKQVNIDITATLTLYENADYIAFTAKMKKEIESKT